MVLTKDRVGLVRGWGGSELLKVTQLAEGRQKAGRQVT